MFLEKGRETSKVRFLQRILDQREHGLFFELHVRPEQGAEFFKHALVAVLERSAHEAPDLDVFDEHLDDFRSLKTPVLRIGRQEDFLFLSKMRLSAVLPKVAKFRCERARGLLAADKVHGHHERVVVVARERL